MTNHELSRFDLATPVAQCDVEDTTALIQFRQKRREWLEWVVGDDDHSIARQIWMMNENYIIYRIINEARRISELTKKKSIANGEYIFRFATDGFVSMQALMIRRLTEKESNEPGKQIVSLQRLVDDVSRHGRLFTREIVIGYDGAPFDPEPAHARWSEQTMERIAASGGATCWSEEYHTSGPEAWRWAEQDHKKFDRLLGPGTSQPRRSDRIPESVFLRMRELVADKSIEKTRELANKRIAHAADVFSRAAAKHGVVGICFNDIDLAHRNLITVAQFISLTLLGQTNIGTVPVPQFDAFEFAETTGLDRSAVRRLRRLADCLAGRRDRWAHHVADLVVGPR